MNGKALEMKENTHMTSPMTERKRRQESLTEALLPVKLGFVQHSDTSTAIHLKENFINYLANMNHLGKFRKPDKNV